MTMKKIQQCKFFITKLNIKLIKILKKKRLIKEYLINSFYRISVGQNEFIVIHFYNDLTEIFKQ